MKPSHVPRTVQPVVFRSLPAIVAAVAGFGFPACTMAQEEKTNYGAVAHAVVGMLQDFHYSGAEFEDNLCRKTLRNYLDTLDYSRLYFTKPEVEAWRAKYETEMDDQLHVFYKIDAAHEIFAAYKKHVIERVAKVKALIQGGKLNFESDDTVEISRKKADWVGTEAELDELWRREIIREVLLERINRVHIDKRKKEKEEANKGTEDKGKVQAKTPDSPEQKVLKRYERILDTLRTTDEEDVTNYFLSAVAQSYDPHSEYLSAPEEDDFRLDMRKELIGIGAVLSTKDGAAEIKSLVPKGPADKSGAIKMGDLIVGVAQGEGEMEDI
jgi:carboxyl-terminal processing protease